MEITMACNTDWLNNDAPPLTTTNTITVANGTANNMTGSSTWYYNGFYYPYYPIVSTWTSSDARPIKLKLSEVETLRKIAQKNKKLKAILNKFTSQIEITVDFD